LPSDVSRTQACSPEGLAFRHKAVNSTFDRLPPPGTFRQWGQEAPPGFPFALKASRFLTPFMRLREPEAPL